MISQEKRAFSKGFTLAEILMVSAIVALIGSIILILSKGAIEKARIAKALNFDAQIYHALGAYAIGVWDFDEGTLETCPGEKDICDSSGNGNHGRIVGDVNWTTEGNTPSKKGRALIFDGMGDYIDCGSLNFIALENYTYTDWLKSNDISLSQTIIDHKCYADSCGISINIDSEMLKLYEGTGGGFIANSSILKSNNWYHFAIVYSSRESEFFEDQVHGDVQIYINGEKDGSGSSEMFKDCTFEDGSLVIGRNPHGCGGSWEFLDFNGTMDNLRIYSEALTSAQIKKLYVEGAKERGLLTKE